MFSLPSTRHQHESQKKEAIQPMMSVIEQVCELIDTTDDVFSFKVGDSYFFVG